MQRLLLTIAALIVFVSCLSQHTVRLLIRSTPEKHVTGDKIFIAGSFNNWNPHDEQFQLKQDEKGNYFISLKLAPGSYEYKITRGGWDKVECSIDGQDIENRVLIIESDRAIEITVNGWKDLFTLQAKRSTASPHVRILSHAFRIPQLGRTRRIWIYLPKDYDQGRQRFPVLYLHDGQNIFEDSSSFSGEWGVDEFMDTMQLGQCIVVAIDNSKEKRMNEYNPYDHERFGKGEGDAYAAFIVKSLKPFIDKHYRTKKDKRHTMIAGSSMGGLISMYAVVKYPNVFGGVGVFSPAFWTAPKIFEDIRKNSKKIKSNIFFYAGKQESERMVPDMLKAFECVSAKSKSAIQTVIRDGAKHNESAWRKEFPSGYMWMRYGRHSGTVQ